MAPPDLPSSGCVFQFKSLLPIGILLLTDSHLYIPASTIFENPIQESSTVSDFPDPAMALGLRQTESTRFGLYLVAKSDPFQNCGFP
ncbi:hypothetical protein DSO57_1022172 [Entomophthora muscae]|uniref:Uncharacterized protein n=1 Tax=Entomophthora muscae TaxID=34485 RepID=A0ACC2RUD5_9FUNG|nr:hypothetical protein DSO57_1022172 [Entomophthora muscae]